MDKQVQTVVLRRAGQFLQISPPCQELRLALRTLVHVPRPQGQSITIGREPGPLFRETTDLEKPALECFIGLLPVVEQVLTTAGYKVEMDFATPTPLPPANVTAVTGVGTCDTAFLDMIRFEDRGLVRYIPSGVEPAWLIAQVALAWPNLNIAVAVTRIDEARWLRRRLLRYLPNVVAVTSRDRAADEMVGRVVVATYGGLGHTGVEIEKRNIVIALNAVEASRPVPLSVLGYARRARMYGLLPLGPQLAPQDRDAIRLLFGFAELIIPQQGMSVPEVVVAKCAVIGGKPFPNKLSATDLKRQAVWQNPVRNRRIAWIARHFMDNPGALFQREPTIAQVLSKKTDLEVLVLVENLEHGEVIAKHLPGWPLVHAGMPWMISQTKGAELTLFPGVSVGTRIKNAITTFKGAKSDPIGKWRVIIRADGGVGMPAYSESGQPNIIYAINNLTQTCPLQERQLVLIDFDDRHHPILRRWSRQRGAEYARQGWNSPGMDPYQARVEQFLATRPGIGEAASAGTSPTSG